MTCECSQRTYIDRPPCDEYDPPRDLVTRAKTSDECGACDHLASCHSLAATEKEDR